MKIHNKLVRQGDSKIVKTFIKMAKSIGNKKTLIIQIYVTSYKTSACKLFYL